MAEAFDAITSDKPYQHARPKSEALHELKEHAGSQFDPAIVDAFLRLVEHSA